MLTERCTHYRGQRVRRGTHWVLEFGAPLAENVPCRVTQPTGDDVQFAATFAAELRATVYLDSGYDVRRDDELELPVHGRVRVSYVSEPTGGHYRKALVSGGQTGR
jgi:hypothetical protein